MGAMDGRHRARDTASSARARPAMSGLHVTGGLLIVLACAALGWRAGAWHPPDAYDPWAPLRIEDEPNWLTDFKLARARRDPALCSQIVGALAWQASAIADRRTGAGCGFENAWGVRELGTVRIGTPLSLSCPAALSLAMWERHTLQPAARQHFESSVAVLDHAGSYACRNVTGSAAGPRSRHATAQALDVVGFRISAGPTITLARDWDAGSSAGAFLREVHQGACRWFDGVLSPDYNAAHADHFHLEVGGWRSCR